MLPNQFGELAPYYNQLMSGVPYKLWVNYIQRILSDLNYTPKTILDVACGTGTVSEILSDKGFKVTGIDLSADMIEVAKKHKSEVDYLVADASTMQLNKKFDMAISLFDSLNYITNDNVLAQAMKRVSEHLVEGGLFIFDVNTIYALSKNFFNQANLESTFYPKYVWRSNYDKSTRICTVNMSFQVLDENNDLKEFKEVHIQKGYPLDALSAMMKNAGFEVVEVYQAYKFTKPNRRSDRVYFIGRKIDE